MGNVYTISEGKPERKKLLAKPKCRWEDNIKIDDKETGCEGERAWSDLSFRIGTRSGLS
jgi:hypothetical protein